MLLIGTYAYGSIEQNPGEPYVPQLIAEDVKTLSSKQLSTLFKDLQVLIPRMVAVAKGFQGIAPSGQAGDTGTIQDQYSQSFNRLMSLFNGYIASQGTQDQRALLFSFLESYKAIENLEIDAYPDTQEQYLIERFGELFKQASQMIERLQREGTAKKQQIALVELVRGIIYITMSNLSAEKAEEVVRKGLEESTAQPSEPTDTGIGTQGLYPLTAGKAYTPQELSSYMRRVVPAFIGGRVGESMADAALSATVHDETQDLYNSLNAALLAYTNKHAKTSVGPLLRRLYVILQDLEEKPFLIKEDVTMILKSLYRLDRDLAAAAQKEQARWLGAGKDAVKTIQLIQEYSLLISKTLEDDLRNLGYAVNKEELLAAL